MPKFNPCPVCSRLMTLQPDGQYCHNCGHEEPLLTTPQLDPAHPVQDVSIEQFEQHAPPTCTQLLTAARDSMDAALDNLTAANSGTCGGLAQLLLLDMVRETSTMAARIRAILNAVKPKEPNAEA